MPSVRASDPKQQLYPIAELEQLSQEDVRNIAKTHRSPTLLRTQTKFCVGRRGELSYDTTLAPLQYSEPGDSILRGSDKQDGNDSSLSILSRLWCYGVSRRKAQASEIDSELVARGISKVLEDSHAKLDGFGSHQLYDSQTYNDYYSRSAGNQISERGEGGERSNLFIAVHKPRHPQSYQPVSDPSVLAGYESVRERRDVFRFGGGTNFEQGGSTENRGNYSEIPELTLLNYEQGTHSSLITERDGYKFWSGMSICETIYTATRDEIEEYELSRGIHSVPNIIELRQRLRRRSHRNYDANHSTSGEEENSGSRSRIAELSQSTIHRR
ncbi:P4b [Rice ragged stunt virus]|uniref:Uncharacterized protein VP4b n=1 Tax=Rice ragged stunt virus (isolate Thailand) TaxID=649603 RepID=VP4B_RRSVT|nr:P4b [Rice ragged stunt virus]O92605.1 RecName: Full=Uncharacterized protein VP4b [Rice ragged stunt virus (isolate Thailand)]AAC36457.1 P4b [Rice ragged stunt virus]